ncbi:MAG: CRTAC1 family protein [Pseudomonadota bacterium]|nr:CRTAC1 family protein [Pseudomonadota bacterium]
MKRLAFVLAAVVVAVLVVLVATDGFDRFTTGKGVPDWMQPLADVYTLDDAGVADFDGDGLLDIFTTNHSSEEFVALGEPGLRFSENRVSDLGLNQVPGFPGLEAGHAREPLRESGFHIGFAAGALVLWNRGDGVPGPVSGNVAIPWGVVCLDCPEGSYTIREEDAGEGLARSEIDFSLAPGEMMIVATGPNPTNGIPVRVTLPDSVPLDQVFVGRFRINPSRHELNILLRDRHSMAWTDLNADGVLDVFIGRGGMRGYIAQVAPGTDDELFLSADGTYENVIDASGIRKASCPGRQSAWVDFDVDGLLDLYVVCGRTAGVALTDPNRLYRQDEAGRFTEVAGEVGLAMPEPGSFLWFDHDNDGDPDLLWYAKGGPVLYLNEKGAFRAMPGQGVGKGPFAKLAKLSVADFDADGYLDVFVASGKQRNLLIHNDAGTLKLVEPKEFGLPVKSFTADWVDYDNDGRMDLHSLPGGMYRQTESGRFEETGRFDLPGQFFLSGARSTWADLDNDGARDLLVALKRNLKPGLSAKLLGKTEEDKGEWTLYAVRNEPSENHWLQIDLTGDDANRQAIGARVEVDAAGRTQVNPVGHAEGAFFSQGHYRAYFGLGPGEAVDAVRVIWPDGGVQVLEGAGSDRRLVIERETIPVDGGAVDPGPPE